VHATHVVVGARTDRDGRLDRVDAGERDGQLADLREALEDAVGTQVAQVDEDTAVLAATLEDLGGLRTRHDVTGGELQLVGRVLRHEALAVLVQEVAALTARTLGDEHAVGGERRRVELHELHVLERHARGERHAHAVTGGGVRVGGRAVHATGAARGEHDAARADGLDVAADHVVGDHAVAVAVRVTDELRDEVLLVHRDVVLDADGPQGVEDDQAGDVRRVTRAGEAGTAERALRDLAGGLMPAEDGTPVLQLDDLAGRLLAEDRDGVLVADVVRPLDGVERVVFGIVLGLVAEGGVDAALRRTGVAPDRVDLGDERHIGTGLFGGDCRPHAGKASAHHHDIMRPHASLSSSRTVLATDST